MFQFTHPGRGATWLRLRLTWAHNCFNSRTPGGVRPLSSVTFICASMFQFTHPGRGATRKLSLHSWSRSFNSRTPGGVRLFQRGDSVLSERFNSRTPGGVRRQVCSLLGMLEEFQFTHPGRGATNSAAHLDSRGERFNSRTPGGVRREDTIQLRGRNEFQFKHPGRGATVGITTV